MDVLTKKQRSYNMSRIRATDTRLEIRLRELLYSNGCRGYRLHYKLLGKPDIVFIGKKIAIFIDGCFWHKCPKCFVMPKTRPKFWKEKITGNAKRDKKINDQLAKAGWKVMRIWGHELKGSKSSVFRRIIKLINPKRHHNSYE